MSEFHERLKLLRKSQRLSQGKIAELLGVAQSNYARYELGRVHPSYAFINKLYSEFGVNLSWLFAGKGKMYEEVKETRGFKFFDEDKIKHDIKRKEEGLETFYPDDEKQKLRAENEYLRERVAKLEKSLIAVGSGESQVDAIMLAEIVARSRELTDRLEKLIIEKGG